MSLNKEILRLAVPSILANMTIPLVGLVDMAIAGHIADAATIGGIAIGTMLFDLLYWNFGFLRVGTSGLTAQAYGRGDWDECNGQLRHALHIALLGAAGIWLIQWLFVTVVLQLVPCSAEVAEKARLYFFIRVWAAPATLSLFAFKGWFIGMQDTTSPMAIDITVNVINMLVSYVMAVKCQMGLVGIAWGTVIAQYVGFVLAVTLLIIRYRKAFVQLFHRLPKPIVKSSGMNLNLLIRSVCFMVVYIGYTSLSSRYGDNELAISSLIMKLFMIVSYFIDGFAYAGEAMVGKAFGEQQVNQNQPPTKTSQLVWTLHLWCLGIAVLFSLTFGLWGEHIMHALWLEVAQAASGWNYLPWLVAMPLLSAPAFMWDGIYVGATASREIRDAMIASAAGFVLVYVFLKYHMGIEAVLYAYFAHLLARDIYLTVFWKRTYDRQISASPLARVKK
ncbi:MAG: MATE family efflux transporter [Paludibacteraceae bacterium]|nr:MATE family efflux transporter [Paludibacteraceae bacterium]